MGNLRSVANAVDAVGGQPLIVDRPSDLAKVDAVILPGVGAFGEAMRRLENGGWPEFLHEHARRAQRPFLGICLGMQLLARRGTEYGEHAGLGWFPGSVVRLNRPKDVRIPHIGWNEVATKRTEGLLAVVAPAASCYFVHSFAFEPEDESIVSATTEYGGQSFVSAVERGNIFGVQFHPEKSQKHGLAILKRFLEV
ncbi:MAG: imidazole glycerol phosphate synthase subunit HisH [Myxococcaceae bacterium]|nr:imidazole glycerol phosphate synthase subunit HisH [Myxococcaceae bacterium]